MLFLWMFEYTLNEWMNCMLICAFGVKNWGLESKRVWHMISTFFFPPSRTIESALESSVSSVPFFQIKPGVLNSKCVFIPFFPQFLWVFCALFFSLYCRKTHQSVRTHCPSHNFSCCPSPTVIYIHLFCI